MTDKNSLGLVPLDEQTVEHDFAILERFQDFSAELLRLALLGISAIGFAVSKMLFPDKEGGALHISDNAKVLLAISLIFFGLATGSALLHRYAAADSMSWHLQAMRRYARGNKEDLVKAEGETARRLNCFRTSKEAIIVASASLGLGALTLAVSISLSLWSQ